MSAPRLTRAQRATLERALYHAMRAQRYLADPTVAVCRKGGPATTSLHYTRADGSALYEVDKDIGSDLTGLGSCIAELARFLAPEEAVPHA